jgi:predicted O-linked N-acetylglucosamine transferase (SPINDLY family)
MGDHPAIANARRMLAAGEAAKAIEAIRSALRRSPQDADLHYNAAGILLESGRPAEAEYFAERASALMPKRGLYFGLVGEVASHLGKYAAAEKAFRKALALDDKLYSSRQNLASLRVMAFDHDEAERLLREAIALRPERSEAPVNLANILVETARIGEARAVAEECVQRHPHDALAAACLANLLNYAPGVEPTVVAKAHERFGAILELGVGPMPSAEVDRDPERVLRVAFVSADFKEHSVAYFIEPVLRHLPRDRVRVVGVSRALRADAMTAVLKSACDEWIEARDLTDDQTAAGIRRAKIDVAVELSGLTQGNSLGAFARRPAPVMLSYLGYPNTSGLSRIAGRLVDATTDPVGEPDTPEPAGGASVRLDPIFLCYRPAAVVKGEAWPEAAPSRVPGPPTFGSFNVVSKLNEPVADAWAAVLRSVPGSKLLMKARSLSSPSLRARLAGWFADRGVEPDRVEMVPYVPSHAEHLALYQHVDVALDPFPYNGTTTTCEALSMGVPVVTFRGRAHAGRVGASILSAVGQSDLIAETPEAYIRLAAGLIADTRRLVELRGSLRRRLAEGTLGDGPGMGVRMEAAIRSVWRAWCAGSGEDR